MNNPGIPDWTIPLSDIDIDNEELAAVERVLRSKWLSMGSEVRDFEIEFADMQSAKYAYAVSNGTAALHLALLAVGVGPGDEVIQPAINFVATANMTVAVGATPKFAEILSVTEPTIDPKHVRSLLSPRTKAIVVMHHGGNLCRMAELTDLAKRHNVALIEDACHAVGAAYHDRQERAPHGIMAGTIGEVGAFSFFSNKNLATGEGGMVVCNNDDIAARMRQLRSHGMTSLTWDRHKGHAASYDITVSGFNYRLDELHACIGRVQLRKLSRNNERRRDLLRRYRDRLRILNGWAMSFADGIDHTAGHLMVAIAPGRTERDKAIQALRERRVQSSLHYPCIPNFSAFNALQVEKLPRSEDYFSRAITLPLFPTMLPRQVDAVVDALASVSRGNH